MSKHVNEHQPSPKNTDHSLTEAQPSKSSDEGISLDSISEAFASMLRSGDDPYEPAPDADADPLLAEAAAGEDPARRPATAETAPDAACQISPQTILEAILFVGTPDNRPISSEQIAGLMRGVRAAEIDELVVELNRRYRVEARPYAIVAEGQGYRMALRDEFAFLRERLHGRTRAARLSPAAVEVLAVVAYNQPVTAEQVAQMRGSASGAVLSQLVRRQLLRIERPAETRQAAQYSTTGRFLKLFGLSSLKELPQSREIE
jgi:segregation and condensation protein B